jgi:glycosyltransferase involved in cell wall biosynthesis
MTRVLLFATHPVSSNGYSKVAYNLANMLSKKPDIELTYFGFQQHLKNPAHANKRVLPSNVQVYDALANEKSDNGVGFGFGEITEFATMNKPDVVIIYNDMIVVSAVIEQLRKVENAAFKIIVYMDQVYPSQKREFIERLNKEADMVLCFSEHWETCIKSQGMIKPTGILWHGFNPSTHFPVPKHLARLYYGFPQDEFIIMNLNRNQPRKRLDIMMMAFAEFISRHMGEKIKLVIATALVGAWNLIEIYERELRIRGISLADGLKHIVHFENPQTLTDDEINNLYNASDIGINTAMGEGWGLCNFEAAAVGIPQIASAVGGHIEFLDHNTSILIKPKFNIYTDSSTDGCPGVADICDYNDFVDALEYYYCNQEIRVEHGSNARKNIVSKYNWEDIGEKLYGYINAVLPPKVASVEIPKLDVSDISVDKSSPIAGLISLEDIESLKNDVSQTNKSKLKEKLESKAHLRKKKNTDAQKKIKDLEDKLEALMKKL